MRIQVKAGRLDQVRGGVQVFGALEGDRQPERLLPPSASRDRALGRLIAASGFRGAANETALLPLANRWILVVGLGKRDHLSL
ncbi:MAG: hypothetical protein HYZ89_01130, partial [Candidatus Omnitrophica bacterium]|nr:hypothetical protein [Candidatus Omnitrophota bacterium]